MLECVLLIGLPGAGKTTFFDQRFASTHSRVSRDEARQSGQPERAPTREVDGLLGAGMSVVVDNTNLRIVDRAPVIDAARRHGAQVVGFFFDVSTRAAVARNALRSGTARVPNVAIFTAAKRLERPTIAEGFDRLLFVQVPRDGGFVVEHMAASDATR